MKLKILVLVSVTLLLTLAACSSNKPKEVVEPIPVRNPLALAHEAAATGNDAYDEKRFEGAIAAFTEAITLFEEAELKAVPTDSIALNVEKMNLNIAKSHIDLAMESSADNSYDEAISSYETALNIYKGLTPVKITNEEVRQNILGVYNNLAIVAKNGGRFEKVIAYYDEILKITPQDKAILNDKFLVLRDNVKDETRAYKALTDYAETSQDPDAFIILADSYSDKGDPVAAERFYNKALALRPDAVVFRRMANFYSNKKDYSNAIVYLEKVIATKPANEELAMIYGMIGKNYEQLNNTKKKVEFYEKAVAINRDPQLALVLASYYNDLKPKNNAKVVSYATITLNTEANNTNALMLRGLAYYTQKNYVAARADLDRLKNDAKWGKQATGILKNIPKK